MINKSLQNDRNAKQDQINEDCSNNIRKAKILIVDDNQFNRVVAKKMLTDNGAFVDEAEDGAQAIQKIMTGNFDLVLMDIQMPVLDGIEATRIIRKEISASLPIIAFSTNTSAEDRAAFFKVGMNAFLSKPLCEQTLIQISAELIKGLNKFENGKLSEGSAIPLYNLDRIQAIAKTNEKFVFEMKELFMTNMPNAMLDLLLAFEKNDLNRFYKIAHRIKPALRLFNIVDIETDIIKLDKIADKSAANRERSFSFLHEMQNKINAIVQDLSLEAVELKKSVPIAGA